MNSLLRRRLLIGENNGYVKDGLILCLDGINNTRHGHDDTTTVWEDLSGYNRDVTLNNPSAIASDHISFVDSTNAGRGAFSAITLSEFTIEAIINRTVQYSSENDYTSPLALGNVRFNYLYAIGNRKVEFSPNGFNNGVLLDYSWFPSGYIRQTSFTAKSGELSVYRNLVNIASNSKTFSPVNISSIALIATAYGDAVSFDYYAIRVYNRVLTEAEMQHNYNLDVQRFGIGA